MRRSASSTARGGREWSDILPLGHGGCQQESETIPAIKKCVTVFEEPVLVRRKRRSNFAAFVVGAGAETGRLTAPRCATKVRFCAAFPTDKAPSIRRQSCQVEVGELRGSISMVIGPTQCDVHLGPFVARSAGPYDHHPQTTIAATRGSESSMGAGDIELMMTRLAFLMDLRLRQTGMNCRRYARRDGSHT